MLHLINILQEVTIFALVLMTGKRKETIFVDFLIFEGEKVRLCLILKISWFVADNNLKLCRLPN